MVEYFVGRDRCDLPLPILPTVHDTEVTQVRETGHEIRVLKWIRSVSETPSILIRVKCLLLCQSFSTSLYRSHRVDPSQTSSFVQTTTARDRLTRPPPIFFSFLLSFFFVSIGETSHLKVILNHTSVRSFDPRGTRDDLRGTRRVGTGSRP